MPSKPHSGAHIGTPRPSTGRERRRRLVGVAAAALVTVWASSSALGGGSEQWRHTGAGAFEKTDLDGTVVDSLGRVSLAFALDALHKPAKTPFVWCLAVDPKGRVLAGTGNQGQLVAIDPKTKKADVIYDSDELEILSLALAGNGTIYAGTGPKGKVIRITPDGKAEVYYQTGAGYVWALALGAKGDLYAGTGPDGKVFRITGPGVGQVLYDSPHTHILSLATDGAGRLYAGSDREGLIYRIDPAGGVFVLYDTPQREVRALVVDADGTVYAAATSGAAASGPRSTAGSRPTPSRPSGGSAPSRPTPRGTSAGGGAAVYRIDPTGVVTVLFRPAKGSILALARRNGALLVATGDEARLYRVALDRPDLVTMLTKVKAKQVLALAVGPDGACYLGTANPGEVHRLGAERMGTGTLTGEVLDARFTALWGRLRWRGTAPDGTHVTVACRSGNVAKPDDTWSPWSKESAAQPGRRGLASCEIECPRARYLQYRLTLSARNRARTPVVREVMAAYLPANQAPEVVSVTEAKTGRPGTPAKPGAGPRPKPKSGNPARSAVMKITWQARDPNGDGLRFEIFFRGDGETLWKSLAKDLTKPAYAWDVTAVPDGRYRLKVVASDAPANSPERALTASRVSEYVVVDRTAPVVTLLDIAIPGPAVRQLKVKADDDLSDIVSADWSLDGGQWTPALPIDQVFDDSAETFLVTVKDLKAGEHTFVLRVEDALGNVGAGKVVFQVK